MTALAMRVSVWTTPLNLAIPAFTVTVDALISSCVADTTTFAAVLIVIPAGSRRMVFPLASSISTDAEDCRRMIR